MLRRGLGAEKGEQGRTLVGVAITHGGLGGPLRGVLSLKLLAGVLQGLERV